MIAKQQNQPTAIPAEGRLTPAAIAAGAQNAVAPTGDQVLIATVDPNQQSEFVGMGVDQLMQLDLYFVPGEETPAKPLGEEEVCPDTAIFASLEPSAEEEEGTTIAAVNAGPVDLQQVEPITDPSGACLGDLTELSLLELMNVRVEAKPTPILPQLRPVDLDSLFDRTEDEQTDLNMDRGDDGHSDTFVPPTPIEPGSTPSFNVAPIAGNDKYSTAEDNKLSVVTGGVLKNDTDGNGDILSVSLLAGTANGTVTLNSNGRFVYTPNADFNGTDSFNYLVSDGNGGFDTGTVTLTVSAVNDAPVLSTPSKISIDEDVTTTVSGISVVDVDAGTGNITVTLAVPSGSLSAVSGGGVVVAGTAAAMTLTGTLADINAFLAGSVSFTTALNNSNDVSLTVTVNDKGNAGAGGAKADSKAVTLDIEPINDAPVAGDDSFTTKEDKAISGSVAGNDSDVDGDPLTYSLLGGPVAGLTFNGDGTFSYAPPLDSNGPVTFDYQVSDGKGGTDTATVTMNVTPVNDAPVAGDDSFITNEDTPVAGTVATNDSDVDGDPLTYSLIGGPVAGLTFNSDGTFSYAPPLNSNGPVTFNYQVSDGKGGTDTATATINVTPVNDAPVAVDDSFTTKEDTPVAGTVATNDSDVDGDLLTYSLVGGPVAGLIFNGDGTFSYAPPLNSNGPVTFDYQVSDGKGGTDTATVTINVSPVNDAPVAGDDIFITNEDTPIADTVATNDSDIDGGALSYSFLGGPVAGLTFNSDGTFSYAPPLNTNGPVTFSYQVSDGKGGTDTATVTINVNPVNDAPVAGDDNFTTNEDTPIASTVATNDSDVDGDLLTYSLVGGPVAGLTFNGDGTFSYAPAPDFNGPVTFDYQVSDGKGGTDTATATINVTPVNDAPVAGNDSFTTDEDTPISDTVATNDSDIDGGALSYSLVGGPVAGLTFNGDGTFTYAPPLNTNGPVTFNYQVSDGKGGTDTATATINVNPVNDAPVALDDSFATNEDTPIAGTVATNDSDVDGDLLTYSLIGGPVAGLAFNGDGSFSYAPPLDSNGPVTFDYQVSDGKGGTDTATVTINVAAVNDAPVAVDDSFTTDEDTAISDTVAANDSDVDGGPLSYSLVGGPVAGLVFNGDGSFSYTPASNFSGPITFNYQVSDGKGGTDTATATINVAPVNDVPTVAAPPSITVTEDAASDIIGITFGDIDAGTNNVTVTLSVTAGVLTAVGSAFVAVVGSGTGIITLTGTVSAINSFIAGGNVDFTTPPNDIGAQTLTATINDGGNTGSGGAKSDSTTVALVVTPVNDAPTDLDLSNLTVDEETSGAVIGTLTVTDPDIGDSHTLTVNDSRFEIVGNQLQLKAGESLDFEAEKSVTVQVTAKDAGGLSYSENFVITVVDKTGSSIGGGPGADSLDGTAQDDTIFGFAGNDTLNGLGAGDSLNGGADIDNLNGGAGNDTLDGGTGSDAIVGGTGNDRIFWDLLDSAIDGGPGTDTLFLNGSDIDLGLAPVASIEAIDMTGGGNNIVILSVIDVIGVSSTGTITIMGDSGDTVFGGGGWTAAGTDANGNNLFTQSGGFGTATLAIDPDVAFV